MRKLRAGYTGEGRRLGGGGEGGDIKPAHMMGIWIRQGTVSTLTLPFMFDERETRRNSSEKSQLEHLAPLPLSPSRPEFFTIFFSRVCNLDFACYARDIVHLTGSKMSLKYSFPSLLTTLCVILWRAGNWKVVKEISLDNQGSLLDRCLSEFIQLIIFRLLLKDVCPTFVKIEKQKQNIFYSFLSYILPFTEL